MFNTATGVKYKFECNQWFGKKSEDKKYWRDIPATKRGKEVISSKYIWAHITQCMDDCQYCLNSIHWKCVMNQIIKLKSVRYSSELILFKI